MKSKRFLINIQYLGFRFHGVQRLPGLPNIQERIESTLSKKFEKLEFKTRFSSRTDALVSALDNYVLAIFKEEQELSSVNEALWHLPPDIKLVKIACVPDDFTILKASRKKTYRYYFSFNEKPHPFSAPFMTVLSEELDIELMKVGCGRFMGIHSFHHYAYKPKPDTNFTREILSAGIFENHDLTANFFPKRSWYFEVSSDGFMRGQVRLMIGSLFRLGKKEITLKEFEASLSDESIPFVKWLTPSSGLVLYKTDLNTQN